MSIQHDHSLLIITIMVKSISENTEWIEKKIVDSLLEGESTPIEHGVAVGFNIGEDLLLNLTPFIERGKYLFPLSIKGVKFNKRSSPMLNHTATPCSIGVDSPSNKLSTIFFSIHSVFSDMDLTMIVMIKRLWSC